MLCAVAGTVALVVAPSAAAQSSASSPGGDGGVTTTTTAPSGAATPAGDGDYQALRDDYNKILDKEGSALKQLGETISKRQAVELQVLSLDTQIKAAQVKLFAAEGSLDQANIVQLTALGELKKADDAVAASKQELKAQVLTTYVSGDSGGGQAGLSAILNSKHQDDGQGITYADAVVRHQKAVIKAYKQAKVDRDRQAELTAAAQDQARAQRDNVVSVSRRLEKDRADRASAAEDLKAQQFYEQLEFNELDKSKSDIVTKVVSLARDVDGVTALVTQAQSGGLPFTFPLVPMVDPVPGSVFTQGFGPQKKAVLGVQGVHPGIDLAGPPGAPIHAAGDGTVIAAGPLGGYGNAVILDHGNHLATLYGHQEMVLVTVGQKVKQNDVLGLRGSTGFSTGPHVHFETRVNGVPVDPLLFIKLT